MCIGPAWLILGGETSALDILRLISAYISNNLFTIWCRRLTTQGRYTMPSEMIKHLEGQLGPNKQEIWRIFQILRSHRTSSYQTKLTWAKLRLCILVQFQNSSCQPLSIQLCSLRHFRIPSKLKCWPSIAAGKEY
jgi:hypothetical protein